MSGTQETTSTPHYVVVQRDSKTFEVWEGFQPAEHLAGGYTTSVPYRILAATCDTERKALLVANHLNSGIKRTTAGW